MSEFSRMTVVASAEIIEDMKTQAAFTSLALQWGAESGCGTGSVHSKVNAMAHLAINENPGVHTLNGLQPLERAMIELAISADENVRHRKHDAWLRLVAGLRFDGFEITEIEVPTGQEGLFGDPVSELRYELRRMLPEDVPETDFREAASEVELLLDQLGLPVTKGHLHRALSAFQRGEWLCCTNRLMGFTV